MSDKRRDWLFLVKMPETGIFIFSFTAYVVLTFIYHFIRAYGIGAANYLDRSELFAFNENAPLWDYFSLIIPQLCVMPGIGLYDYICKNKIMSIIHSKESRYERKMTQNLAYLIFAIVFMGCILSLLLNYLRFESTGITYDDFKLSMAYVNNMENGDKYVMCRLHIYHPFLYNLIYSVSFSAMCAIISHETTSFIYGIKEVKDYMVYIASMILSFAVYEIYEIGDINIWHFFIVSHKTYENPAVSLCFVIILILAPKLIGKVYENVS
ncbi:MAG: hypothetical protein J6X36_01760 [Lachnospiraceae bacterium]|nr:hypothetical protein [Lachnospiraceae bacterium]